MIDYAEHPQIQKYSKTHCIGYSVFTHGSTADWASKDIHPEVAAMQADYGSQHQIEMDGEDILQPLYQVEVIAAGLNFRDKPSLDSNIIRVLPNSEILDVMDDEDRPWLNLRDLSGVWGFAYEGDDQEYLEKIDDTDPPPDGDLEKRMDQVEIDIAVLQDQVKVLQNTVGDLESSVIVLTKDYLALDRRVENLESGTTPVPNRRYSQSIEYLGMDVQSVVGSPGARVLHAWTTHNGQWSVDPGDVYAVEQWAIDLYLKDDSGEAGFGGDHHMFALVQDKQGAIIPSVIDFRWPDGVATRSTSNNHNGWVNIPITGSFVPERGEEGLWTVAGQTDSEVFGKFALPSNQHVSLYVVFEV